MLHNQSVVLSPLEEIVANLVYDFDAIDHRLSHIIQLFQVR